MDGCGLCGSARQITMVRHGTDMPPPTCRVAGHSCINGKQEERARLTAEGAGFRGWSYRASASSPAQHLTSDGRSAIDEASDAAVSSGRDVVDNADRSSFNLSRQSEEQYPVQGWASLVTEATPPIDIGRRAGPSIFTSIRSRGSIGVSEVAVMRVVPPSTSLRVT
jgi:hypothetical protein